MSAPGVTQMAIVALLADGALRSGEAIAQRLGVSRTAVWKHVRELAALGLAVEAVAGQGYRLAVPLELLDGDAIRAAAADAPLRELAVFAQLDSTNSWLMARQPPLAGELDACLAETQIAGRGRRGRPWAAPLGGGLYLSMAWHLDRRPPDFSALSLATGVAVCEALAELGVREVQLKWPNDLVVDGGKLGGILVEMRGEADGPAEMVIGVGINVCLPAEVREGIAPSWGRGPVDLVEATGRQPIARNRLAGRLIARTAAMLKAFQQDGFAPFREAFMAADYLRGRPLQAPAAGGAVRGHGAGVDADGALRVETAHGVVRVVSGEVSVVLG
jgi:BirA family transcriptional regulator, biotin operon repressor / biotin---[acetyl-CoA-carboxylase] ligase